MKNTLFFLFLSCSLFQQNISENKKKLEISNDMAYRHLISVFENYKISSKENLEYINGRKYQYLSSLASKIIISLKENFSIREINNNFKFIKINDERPYYFSSPQGDIFFSSGLIHKYIKHESLLISVLTYELIRIVKRLYPKEAIIPIGYYSLAELMKYSRLPINEKSKIHKWAYNLLKEIDVDQENYLLWLQTQNRNFMDFDFFLGDKYTIFKEEQDLRQYIVSNISHKKNFHGSMNKSSKDFYRFIKRF